MPRARYLVTALLRVVMPRVGAADISQWVDTARHATIAWWCAERR